MKRKLLLFILLVLIFARGFSQNFFSATNKGNLELVTINGNGIVSKPVGGCGGSNYYSIAVLGSKMFYCTAPGNLYSGDITLGNAPTISNCTLIGKGIGTNALTVDSQGVFYYVTGFELYAFDPKNPVSVDLGTMPYLSLGDLTFYHDELYLAAPQGIVHVTLNDPSKSTMYIESPDAVFIGLTTVTVNGISTVYGANGTNIVQVDMDNRLIKGVVGTVTNSYDLGSINESGTVLKVKIDSIAISRECSVFNKGHVQIYGKPDGSNYTYTLNSGQKNTTGIFDNLAAGAYVVTVISDKNELLKKNEFTIPNYSLSSPAISAVLTDQSCLTKGQIKLDAGNANSLYTIKYGNNIWGFEHVFKDLNAGTYKFTILNNGGCIVGEKNYTLQFNCPIIIDSVHISKECDTLNRAHIAIITEPHIYQYTYTLNTSQTDTSGVFDNLAPGKYSVTVTSSGKQAPQSINFTVNDFTVNNLVITVAKKNPICNTPGQIKLDAGLANSIYSIKYRNDVFGFDHTFAGLSSGRYHFVILDENGCIVAEKDYTLQEEVCPPIIVDSISVVQQCDAFNRGHVKVYCEPDSTQHTFTLNTGQTDTTGIFDNLMPGSYQLAITSNGNRLQENTTFTVADYTANNPVITFIAKKPICILLGEIKLDAGQANSSYAIKYGNDIFNFDHTFTGLSAGTYHFVIVNKKGCIIDEKDYMLQQNDCPPIIINNIQTAAECDVFGQASLAVIVGAHAATYTYTLNGVSDTTGVFDFLAPGTYNLTITSLNGNNLEQQVTVPDYTLNAPNITYVVKNPVCTLLGEIKFITDSGNAVQVKHGTKFYKLNETITGLNPGSNTFTFFNQQGCVVDTLALNILQDDCKPVVFPNAFTPNGDEINDVFRPNQDSNPTAYKLLVFNRWGKLLFQSQNFLNGWNGYYGSRAVPFGVYYWIATYTMPDGKKEMQSGFVTLIK